MSIETEEVAAVVERSGDLAAETAQALIDSAYLAPRQTIELSQAILRTIEANQQTTRDLAGQLVKQTLEGQALWWQFFQESMRMTTNTFARAAEAGFTAAREGERTGSGHAAAAEKRGAPAGK